MRSAVLTLVVNGLLERSVTLQLATQDGTATGTYTVYVMGIYIRPNTPASNVDIIYKDVM